MKSSKRPTQREARHVGQKGSFYPTKALRTRLHPEKAAAIIAIKQSFHESETELPSHPVTWNLAPGRLCSLEMDPLVRSLFVDGRVMEGINLLSRLRSAFCQEIAQLGISAARTSFTRSRLYIGSCKGRGTRGHAGSRSYEGKGLLATRPLVLPCPPYSD